MSVQVPLPAKLLVAATWRNLDIPRERFQRNVGILHEVATTKGFAGGYLCAHWM